MGGYINGQCFFNNYSYVVTFSDTGKLAGNHYHKEKEELFYCLSGQVSIILQHIDSKKREEIKISASENKIVFIPKMTGHVIVSKAPNTTFLVIASRPSVEGDEFLYKVI